MSVIRARRLASGRVTGNALTNALTALPNQTIKVEYITGIANAGGLFDLFLLIFDGANNIPVAVVPCRGVLNSGLWAGGVVMNPNDILKIEPANGGPGWDYSYGIFGFSLTS